MFDFRVLDIYIFVIFGLQSAVFQGQLNQVKAQFPT